MNEARARFLAGARSQGPITSGQRRLRSAMVVLAMACLLLLINYVFLSSTPALAVLVPAGLLWYGVVIADWRRAFWGLVAFMPFIGVIEVITYPATAYAVLAKDVAFVVPCYVVLLLAVSTRQQTLGHLSLPYKAASLFVIVVLAEMLNPWAPPFLVEVIAAKVWLSYIPFMLVAPLVLDTRARVTTFLRLMAYLSAIPSTFGVLEFLLIHANRLSVVEALYGKAADAMLVSNTVFKLGGGSFLTRIPSTFSSVAQYLYYLLATTTCSLALALTEERPDRRRAAWALVALNCLAILTTGERGAFVYLPVLLLLALLLTGGTRYVLRAVPFVLIAVVGGVAAFGTAAYGLLTMVSNLAVLYGNRGFNADLAGALERTVIGLGTGTDTNAAWRYAHVATVPGTAENWMVKVIIELGLPGLIAVIILWGSILYRGWQRARAQEDRAARVIGFCLIAGIITTFFISFKESPIDLDPMDVFIWIFAGMLLCPPVAGVMAGQGRAREGAR